MKFETISKFDKEFKKLFKKYKTLDQDLEIFKSLVRKQIQLFITKSSNHHAILHSNKTRITFALKSRLQCRALKNSNLRIVYLYLEKEDKIVFIELFFKGDKSTEDTTRWRGVLQKLSDRINQ